MMNKRKSLFIIILVILSSISLVPNGVDAYATPPLKPDQSQIDTLDYSYINEVVSYLSEIIHDDDVYGTNEIAKGRYFGSDGEHYAKDYIKDQFEKFFYGNVEVQELDSIWTGFKFSRNIIQSRLNPEETILSQYDINSMSLTITKQTPQGPQQIVLSTNDFFITPCWGYANEIQHGDFDWENHDCDFIDLQGVMFQAGSTVTFGQDDVKIYDGKPLLDLFESEMLMKAILIDYFMNNHNIDETEDYIISLIENSLGISFDDMDPEDPFWESIGFDGVDPEEHFFIVYEDPWNNIYNDGFNTINEIFGSLSQPGIGWRGILTVIIQRILHTRFENFMGEILYDNKDNPNCHNNGGIEYSPRPVIFVNNSLKDIGDNPTDYTLSVTLTHTFETDTKSYNVICKIPGEDTTATVLIGCLYDSMWNEGTADAAIGVGIALAIVKEIKYFDIKYGIIPKYNIEIVAFCGEEAGIRGAIYYNKTNENKNIIAMIDLNQIGFRERVNTLTLNLLTFDRQESKKIEALSTETDYPSRVDGESKFFIYLIQNPFNFGDFGPFVKSRDDLKSVVGFFEDTGWSLHHRAGDIEGDYNRDGDAFIYYDEIKIKVTGEMVWNTTKYYAYDHESTFVDTAPQTFEQVDIDSDGDFDSIKAVFSVNSEFPHDRVTVRAKLIHNGLCKMITRQDFDITFFQRQCSMTVTLPPNANLGLYRLILELLNTTERIEDKLCINNGPLSLHGVPDDTIDQGIPSLKLLYPRGNTIPEIPDLDLVGEYPIHPATPRLYDCNTIDQDGDKVAYLINWDWGNPYSYEMFYGTVESGQECRVLHTYDVGGDYIVSVRCRESYENLFDWVCLSWSKWGSFSEKSYTPIHVEPGPLYLSLTENPKYTTDSLQIIPNEPFDVFAIPALHFEPTSYTWTVIVEGREAETYYTENLSYEFSEIGSYLIELNITNSNGDFAVIEAPIKVTNLIARFTSSWNYSNISHEIIYFNDTSIGVRVTL